MIRNHIVRDYSDYARAHRFETTQSSLKEEMRTNAIHDNGICKTFSFSEKYYDIILNYIKIEAKDIELYPDMFEIRSDFKDIYLHHRTDKSIMTSCLKYIKTCKIDDKLNDELEKIREICAKKYNGVYSTVAIDNINIDDEYQIISIHYSYFYIKDDFINKMSSYDAIFGEVPLPYGEWFIDYFGPYPKDRPRRNSITSSKDATLNKECIDCSAHDPKIITINHNQSFTIYNDKLYMSNRIPGDTYGNAYCRDLYKYSLVMTKEVFQECYNRWIKPQEEGNSIEQ